MIQNLKPHEIRGNKFRMQLFVEEILSDNKIFDKFSELLGIELDHNSEIFHFTDCKYDEIEEFIVDKLMEIHEENNNKNK
tara:strand:+ start:4801 stop:5040 length:240 start_codon:yes stop_codon:yes gene_type:complete